MDLPSYDKLPEAAKFGPIPQGQFRIIFVGEGDESYYEDCPTEMGARRRGLQTDKEFYLYNDKGECRLYVPAQ